MSKLLSFGMGVLLLGACTPQQKVVAKSSGSIGITRDDALLYVADADHDRVTVIDAQSRAVLGHIAVGLRPERIMVGPDDSVFVTNRGERSVMRIAPGGMSVEAIGAVGAEPVGMALSGDGQKLYVANSMSGSVSVLDALTLAVVEEVAVGGEPWAVQLLDDDRRGYVTDFKAGHLTVVDLPAKQVLRQVELNQASSTECQWADPGQRTPAQAADVVVSPDGTRAYVAHVQSRTRPSNDTGFASLALAVAPALSTVDTGTDLAAKDVPAGSSERPDFPATLLATQTEGACRETSGRGPGMDAPSSLVVDGAGEWIFVADHNSNAVAVVSALRQSEEHYRVPDKGIYDVVRVGARPTGIAVSADLRTAYVHNAFDYSVSVVENRDRRLTETATISFASSTLPAHIERGRRLFYSAVDPRLTRPELGGVSCSSCHPDGRADGLSWVLPSTDVSWDWDSSSLRPGARNTQPLWGALETAPYHWDGKVEDMPALSHVMVSQMGGFGLSATEVSDLSGYLKTVMPPDNPNVAPASPAVLAGARIFAERCTSCHAGAQLTDATRHLAQVVEKQLDTPSLRGVFATGPYLHDGSVGSLREVVRGTRFTVPEHDLRGALDEEQTAELEAYLKTL